MHHVVVIHEKTFGTVVSSESHMITIAKPFEKGDDGVQLFTRLALFQFPTQKKFKEGEETQVRICMPYYQHHHHQYHRNMSLEYDFGDNGDKDDTVVDDDEEDKICNAF